MITVERLVQKVRPGKWAELGVFDKQIDAVERACGFPPKKRYQCVSGGHDDQTLIIEREWPSLAAAEAAYAKVMADPAYQKLGAEMLALIESTQRELYAPLP